MSNRVTIEQLLQQVERLENRLNEVVDAVVSKRLPRELTDKFDLNISRKNGMSDEDMMAALGMNMGTEEGLNEGLSEGLDFGMSEGLGEERPASMNAPVDMQGIAEPEMPMGAM